MIVVVIVLVITNLATLVVLAWLMLRTLEQPRPARSLASVLDGSPPPPELSSSATRQLITIEILNPIELAGSRGRLAGLAGMIVPGITKRVVHDQAIKIVKRTLSEQQVVADVRLHTIRPGDGRTPPRAVIDLTAGDDDPRRAPEQRSRRSGHRQRTRSRHTDRVDGTDPAVEPSIDADPTHDSAPPAGPSPTAAHGETLLPDPSGPEATQPPGDVT